MSGWPAVLRPGDWVTFNGDEHQVVATAIGELLTGFWSIIAGMCHEWRHRWTVDETTAVLETRAHYTTHAGTDVTVPCPLLLVCQPRVDLDRDPAVDAVGRFPLRPQHIAGLPHVVGGHGADRGLRVSAALGQLAIGAS
jgi:hypothetical protein